MQVISVANQKGGVAKTTSAINIAYYLANSGYKVLLIDFDPQSSASSGLGHRSKENSVYELLCKKITPKKCIKNTSHENLKILPSNQDLAAFEFEAINFEKKESKLKEVLKNLSNDFDYAIIDCPPSLGLLTINALVASKYILIPVQSEFFALEGLSLLLETASKVKKMWNLKLEVLGILLTMFDSRTMLHKEVFSEIKKHFGSKTLNTYIKRNIKLAEASSFGKSIGEYDKNSVGGKAYFQVVKELLKKMQKPNL